MSISGVGQNTMFNNITNLQGAGGSRESMETAEHDGDADDMAGKAAAVTSAQATGGVLGSRLDLKV